MIIELVGLPGSGKTTVAEAMRVKGAVCISISSRTQLFLSAGMFWLIHPILACELLGFILVQAPREVRYELFVNGYLGYAARYREARLLSRTGALVVLDQGFFQLFVSLEGLSSVLSEAFPKPDVLAVVAAPSSTREERMARRGWAPRAELGPEKRLAWQRRAEAAFHEALPTIERLVRLYRYDGSQNPEEGATALIVFAKKQTIVTSGSSLRGVLKTVVAILSFVLARLARIFDRTSQVVVLMYHAVDTSGWKLAVSPKVFEQQIKYLLRRGWVVPLADVVAYAKGEKKLGAHAVAVTFDDGYRDVLEVALPILERYGIPATVFIPSDFSVHTDPSGRARLTEEELHTLAHSPLITIGSHAKTHRKFTELSLEEMRNEALESADTLMHIAGERPRFFAYPFGARSADAERAVKDAGYEAAFSITEGTIHSGDNLFRLKRVQVDGTMGFFLFRLRLTSAVDWNRRIVDRLRVLMPL